MVSIVGWGSIILGWANHIAWWLDDETSAESFTHALFCWGGVGVPPLGSINGFYVWYQHGYFFG